MRRARRPTPGWSKALARWLFDGSLGRRHHDRYSVLVDHRGGQASGMHSAHGGRGAARRLRRLGGRRPLRCAMPTSRVRRSTVGLGVGTAAESASPSGCGPRPLGRFLRRPARTSAGSTASVSLHAAGVPSHFGGIGILLRSDPLAGERTTGGHGYTAFRGTGQRRQHRVCSRRQCRQRRGLDLALPSQVSARRRCAWCRSGDSERRRPDPGRRPFRLPAAARWPSNPGPVGPAQAHPLARGDRRSDSKRDS